MESLDPQLDDSGQFSHHQYKCVLSSHLPDDRYSDTKISMFRVCLAQVRSLSRLAIEDVDRSGSVWTLSRSPESPRV